ncbi:anthranilate phosphoribosyltransferase [Flammeovirga yaeyamensis]|uniref:Anthranilate phosphoribosyltransferase n=1 Tax=Flammeovirga yaeyamensis TaxID=367791 RepID=A0AAX1N2H1_9BACT|nr:anthranilate phosphoribosyltransferase [Flammeovirga yaeyamensis]MBB3701215.1 anthranilate phosphoribosyltransferase [Flammeovirga yaeyamensis]NMF38459.1 anthranilate phosphoribosyltransferase [Flammeovirga yaeyamensis]QWG01681.1 anthranilate phosphoribosyltransferase [Flammeovirga yaeyamensis]
MKKILNRLFEYGSLSEVEARETLTKLAQGEFNPSQIAAFLTVYSMRSITVEELTGFRDAMLELCLRIDLDDFDAMDLCGTGGDGQDTFNISTLSSFIVAGAGQNVAKHGNNGVSSVCGSSNLMAHFGYDFTNDVDTLKRNLEEAGICFIHAPLFHPAMKNVAPIRRELGVKTFFNMLGPMVNPSFPKKQIVGVFSLEIARLYGYLYQQTDKQFAILHSLDIYDEISLTSPFKMITKDAEKLLKPEDLGLNYQTKESLFGGGSIAESAKIFTDILENKGTEPQKQAVLANAGVAIATGKGLPLIEGVAQAKESLASGAALNSFKKLIAQ